jgi:hypothetical protein
LPSVSNDLLDTGHDGTIVAAIGASQRVRLASTVVRQSIGVNGLTRDIAFPVDGIKTGSIEKIQKNLYCGTFCQNGGNPISGMSLESLLEGHMSIVTSLIHRTPTVLPGAKNQLLRK